MKKILVFLCTIFVCTFTFAHTINWYVGDQIISTTTCDSGDNITPPTAPAKYGYHFKGWKNLYTSLEYIESTGTQWIDTGIVPTFDYTFEIKALKEVGKSLIGSGGTNYTFTGGSIDNINFIHMGGVTTFLPNTIDNSVPHIWAIRNGKIWCDDTGFTLNIGSTTPTLSWALFARKLEQDAVSDIGSHTVYYVKLYDANGVLVRDFIPVRRVSDNAIGMYDTVTKTFFPNAGTGEFIAGPEVQ